MPTINEIINGDSEDTAFLESLAGNHQSRLLESIRTLRDNISNLMRELTTSDSGRLEGVKVNLKQSQQIHKQLVTQFEKDYNTKVNRVVGDFSAIETSIKRRYRALNEAVEFTGIDDKMLSALKQNTYTRYVQFGEDARNQIATAMYNSVAGGTKFSSLLNTITGILTGHEDVRGRPMTIYANGFAHDAVMNYHNQVNTAKGEDIGLDHFLYYGDLIETSRPFCITRVGKVYTKRQILAWDSLQWKGKAGSAWTERGGYNCRHHWRPVRKEWMLDEDGEEVIPQNEMIAYMHSDSDPKIKELTQKIQGKTDLYKEVKTRSGKLYNEYMAMVGKKGPEWTAKRKPIHDAYRAAVEERKVIKAEIEKLRAELGSIGGKIKKTAKKKVIAVVEPKVTTKVKQPKVIDDINKKIIAQVKQVKQVVKETPVIQGKLIEDELVEKGILEVVNNHKIKDFENVVLKPILEETERMSSYSPIMRQSLASTSPLNKLEIFDRENLSDIGHDRANGIYYGLFNKRMVLAKGKKMSLKENMVFKRDQSWSASHITKTPITTFRHEMGHHIHHSLDNERYWNNNSMRERWELLHNTLGNNWFKKNVTTYSGTNMNEAFAESFAIFTSKNYKKGWLPGAIEDFFDKLFSTPDIADKAKYISTKTETAIKLAAQKAKPNLMAVSYSIAKDCVLDDYKPNACKDYVRRKGTWFIGEKKVEKAVAKRLEKMRIPPAWEEVVVAKDSKAKIQAIGLDKAGRWQYRYSKAHIDAAKRKKFVRLENFRKDMPKIEKQIANGMKYNDSRAYLLQLENKTAIRIGTDRDFKAKKKAYGLTTLQSEHVSIKGNNITLKFTAKEGIPVIYKLEDKQLAKWLAERKSTLKRGEKMFPDVPSNKLNEYLKEISGKSYTVKDFRTYHGTRIAYEELEKYAGKTLTAKEKKQVIKEVSEKVSKFLSNTPTMAKNSYINPMVWDFIGGL